MRWRLPTRGLEWLLRFTSLLSASAPALVVAASPSDGRVAAQRGLGFLARETPAWQKRHNCYGCHVQAVTMQAIATAAKRDYRMSPTFIQSVLAGLTVVPGGARSEHGLSHSGGREESEAKSYGGSALAAYDQHVSAMARDDLLSTAQALLRLQRDDGSVRTDVARFPVSPSTVHTTYRAVQTWRQAYARTADDAWRAPLRRGEVYLATRAKALVVDAQKSSLQDLNFAALGLLEAGVGASEPVLAILTGALRGRQREDGAWAFGAGHVAYATGQTLYTLRMLGVGESDPSIVRGTAWLTSKQNDDGAWSSGGSAKAETMWAVLGLVSIDVVGIDLVGIQDGDRVDGAFTLQAQATDNHGTTVDKIELFVDDVLAHTTKNARMKHTLDASEWSTGPHLIDVVATNRAKKAGRRRIKVYAGHYYLTDLGSRFVDGGTTISLRNLGRSGATLRWEILDGSKVVALREQPVVEGPMTFHFVPKPTNTGRPSSTFVARVSYVHAQKVLQTVTHEFVHASLDVQQREFGAVQGSLAAKDRDLANTWVELVDEKGQVVRRAKSTRSGQYRFKNVEGGKYKVRVKKRGFRHWENDVQVERGRAVQNDVSL